MITDKTAVMNFKTIIIIVLAIIVTILTIQNIHEVELNILFWKGAPSLIVVIFIMLGLGFAAGYFLKSMGKISKKEKSPNDTIKIDKK